MFFLFEPLEIGDLKYISELSTLRFFSDKMHTYVCE